LFINTLAAKKKIGVKIMQIKKKFFLSLKKLS